jgi:hypothetical protein
LASFLHGEGIEVILNQMLLGKNLGDFFTSSSGHPEDKR